MNGTEPLAKRCQKTQCVKTVSPCIFSWTQPMDHLTQSLRMGTQAAVTTFKSKASGLTVSCMDGIDLPELTTLLDKLIAVH